MRTQDAGDAAMGPLVREMKPTEAQTYLRTSAGQFVLAREAEDAPADEQYVEGFIRLTVDGTDIIDQSMWDYVDQLSAYITDMMIELDREGQASTYFPDQPIKLTFQERGAENVLVSSQAGDELRSAVAERDRLVSELRREGLEFFRIMSRLAPKNASVYLELISKLSSNT